MNPPIEPAVGDQITNPAGETVPVKVIPKAVDVPLPGTIISPDPPAVPTPSGGPTITQHVWDIALRSLKTFLATFTATLTASGLDITHPSVAKQLLIAALSAGLTAVLNTGIKVYQTQN